MLFLLIASTTAAAAIAFALFHNGIPDDGDRIVLAGIGVAAAAAPPMILLVFLLTLREVLELPDRLRALPEAGREHAAELGRLVREAHGRGASLGLPRVLWRFGRLVDSARGLLTPWAPLMPLLSVPFLLLTALAAAAAVIEVAVALAALAAVAR